MRPDEPDTRPDPAGKGNGGPREPGERITEALARRVRAFAFQALAPGRRATSNLYLDPVLVKEGAIIGPRPRSYEVTRDSWLVFADHHPRAAFGHNCSYYLHDAATGKVYRRIAAQFPPHPTKDIHQLERFHQPVPPVRSFPLPPPHKRSLDTALNVALSGSSPAGKRYAILLAGQCDRFHVNDLELSYRTLIDTFHFDAANIIVLIHNGTKEGTPFLNDDGVTKRKWPGDNTDFRLVPNGSGTRDAFRNWLPQITLAAGDLLFVHTAGHGDTTSRGQCMCLRPDGGDQYFSDEMEADLLGLLGGVKCQSLLVLMNQCYSGGFSDSLLTVGETKAKHTFFAAACGADDWANSTEDEQWSEFALHWYEAEMQSHVNRQAYMPGTDDDDDGKVEASEAYDYCVFINTVSKGFDSPVLARLPEPDEYDKSTADEIVLT
jgi:hypothetical protein